MPWSTTCPRRPIARPSRRSTSRPASRRCAGRSTPIRCPCWPSRSWTTRTSARSPSAGSIRARCSSGMALTNTTRDRKERVGRMYLMHADEREQIDEAYAGDIIALAGLKDTRTGETLSDPNKAVLLEKMEFPNPVIEMKVEPKTKADVEKMGLALAKLAAEDPSFRVSTDQESGETIIKGMGELHLDIKVDILKRTHKVEVNVGAPQVAYRETIARADRDRLHAQEADRRHRPVRARQAADRAQRARQGQRVRERDRRRRGAEGVHPRRREGRAERLGCRRADRLPDGRHDGHALRRRLPRGGLQHHRLRDRGARGHARGLRRRPASSCSSRSWTWRW